MHLDPREAIDRRLALAPTYYDVPELETLASLTTPGCLFVDLGANVGAYTAYMHVFGAEGIRTISIEPNPAAFESLALMVTVNQLQRARCLRVAVGDYQGKVQLNIETCGNRGRSRLNVDAAKRHEFLIQVNVDIVPLLELVPEHIDILKLDLEGSEWEVLERYFRECASYPTHILLEQQGDDLHSHGAVGLCLAHGYNLERQWGHNYLLRWVKGGDE